MRKLKDKANAVKQDRSAGKSGEELLKELTWIGTVSQAHGILGAVKVSPMTQSPEYYVEHDEFYLQHKEQWQQLRPESIRLIKGNQWIMLFKEFTDRNTAEKLKGARLYIPDKDLKPLAEDEYFQHDIIGCEVFDTQGTSCGTVKAIFNTGANDIYVLEQEQKEFYIPALKDVLLSVDVIAKKIVIDPLEGMLE